MGTVASQITSLTIVYTTVYSDADQSKHQSPASLVFVWGNSPGTGEFPAQMTSIAEIVSIWWRHHVPIIIHTTIRCVWFICLYVFDLFVYICQCYFTGTNAENTTILNLYIYDIMYIYTL